MNEKKRHPHIERPTEEQLAQLLQDKTPKVRQIYLNIHALVLEILPDVVYSVDCKDGVIGYGAHQYGYNGWGMMALAAHTKWVSLLFMDGVALNDSEGLLEGTGKKMRHVKMRSVEQVEEKESVLSMWIGEAAKKNKK